MTKKSKKKTNASFSVILNKIYAVLLILFAASVYLSLMSYHQTDANFNNTAQSTQNLLGAFGSNLAEGVLWLFGLSLPVFVSGCFVWGYSLLKHNTIIEFKSRLFAFLTGIFSTALFLSAFEMKNIFPYGLGGNPARQLYAFINSKINTFAFPYSTEALSVLLGFIAFISFNLVMGLTFKMWFKGLKRFFKILWTGTMYLRNIIAKLLKLLFGKKKATGVKRKIEPQLNTQAEKTSTAQSKEKPQKKTLQAPKTKDGDSYVYPDINLLSRPKDKGGFELSQKELDATARELEGVLQEFSVNGKIVRVRPGPVVTLYELEPAPGTKTARVISLADDIARSMCAVSVRIAVVPGSNTIGIELPNKKRETVWLKDLLEDPAFKETKNNLNIVLGKDIGGKNTYADLAKMPHLLVAGTTGSGKSVGVNSMILSLLYRMKPEECKLIMIDPKMLEFSMYNGIPHLLTPVITDPAKAVVGLKWAVREMEERYRKMAQLNVRNILGYNQKLAELRESGEKISRTIQVGFDSESGKPIYEEQELDTTPLPYIVIVVDEMADLMLVAGKEVEAAIQRLAQMARAAGIHLIMSTQRPSVDVITGTIKANFPSRISFQVTSKIDSRTILGEQGAEQLLGMGDMLYMPAGLRPLRVHGSFVKDSEVESVVEFLKAQREPEYVSAVTEGELNQKDGGAVFDNTSMGSGSDEDLYTQALAIVRNDKKASTSYIQRRLRIGYNRAAALIDRMEEEGIVSAADHVGRREVIG